MKVIAIAMQKGGVGKSMLARSIAVAAAGGGLASALFDMDPQQTSALWHRRRALLGHQLPVTSFVPEMNLGEELARMRDAGCDLVVIDTPPAKGSEAFSAIEKADLVVIPCTPTIEAYEQIARTATAAKLSGKPAVAVLNLVTPNSQSQLTIANAVFEKFEMASAPVVLHRYTQHAEAGAKGLTATDAAADSKAKAEVAELWTWLRANLGFQANVVAMKRRA